MKNNEVLDPSVHLEIYKVYVDGSEELVFDEDNTDPYFLIINSFKSGPNKGHS